MYLDRHCQRTKDIFGKDYREIHEFLDRHFDAAAMERWSMLTSGDYYPGERRPDPFAHRKIEHHREGISAIVEHFKDRFDPDIVCKIAIMHIEDDYNGYLPSKVDFEDQSFLRKYHA